MAIENDFLPFAVGSGANVLSQSAYAALTSLLQNGFQSGIANSQQLNKVWRQSSIMAAVIAQFIVAETGQTAIDDGTTATLLANFTTAVAAAARSRIILTDTGSANAYTAANPSPLTALPTSTGLFQSVSIANANTGASTYAPDGLAAKPIYGLGLQPLQGGELVAKGIATMIYVVASTVNSGLGAWVLLENTGGAAQLSAGSYVPTPALGDTSTKVINAAFANRLGLKYVGVTAVTGNKTMAVGDLGGIFPIQATANITLPLASSVPIGSTYTFFYYQSANVPTFLPTGADVFSAGSGNISTYTPKSTGYIQFTAEVSGLWEITGSATLDQSTGFTATTSYFKLPSGKIVAWVYGSASTAGISNTMPITFPNAIRTISVTCNAAKGGAVYSVAGNISSTSVVDATASGTCNVFIIAIGD